MAKKSNHNHNHNHNKQSTANSSSSSSSSSIRTSEKSSLIVVLPGDNVTCHIASWPSSPAPTTAATVRAATTFQPSSTSSSTSPHPKIVLGTGLRYDATRHQVYATMAGRLDHRIVGGGAATSTSTTTRTSTTSSTSSSKAIYFIRHNAARYDCPAVDDRVIGIVQDRLGSDGTTGGDWYQVELGASHLALLNNLSFEGATKRNKPQLSTGQVIYARVARVDSNDSNVFDPILSCQLGPLDQGIVPKKIG